MDRRLILCVSVLIGAPCLASCQMGYVVSQGWRQWTLGWGQVPLESESLETVLDASEREKLAWIPRVLEHCRSELGLDPGDSYTTFLDTGGQPISYVVTAAHPLALVPYRWRFPFVGEVPYKGYFDLEDAASEASRLAERGYDTAVHPVGAYSTLGWFRDPVLSAMLEYDLPELIDLIIHETTHRTVYFDDETSFNESLATHIAAEGTRRFLRAHADLRPFLADYRDRRRTARQAEMLLIRLHRDLDRLYRSSLPDERKLILKTALFRTASRAYSLVRGDPEAALPASNTTVLAFVRYHEYLPLLEELQAKSGGHPRDLTSYLLRLKRTGRSISELLDSGSLSSDDLARDGQRQFHPGETDQSRTAPTQVSHAKHGQPGARGTMVAALETRP